VILVSSINAERVLSISSSVIIFEPLKLVASNFVNALLVSFLSLNVGDNNGEMT